MDATGNRHPVAEIIMPLLVFAVPAVCVVLGCLTALTLGGREPGSPAPDDYLPMAGRRKTPGGRKPKSK
jgi:hypothetical protein